jgi:mannose-6-phosphate isomerase-like protein (cupin superfamily)
VNEPGAHSQLYAWEATAAKPTKVGFTRPFFKMPTGTLDLLSCHVTTLNPGEAPHAPHRHPEEEMIILREGTLEALHNGQTERMSTGSVLLLAPNDLHGVRNVGDTPATYYVLKWFTPATVANARTG